MDYTTILNADYSVLIHFASILMAVMAVLVFATNIIVEVVKKLFPKVPTTLLATILSVVITMVAFFAWATIIDLAIRWYYVAAAFVLGLFVAYAAMFGFDKFKAAWEKLKALKK